MPVDMSAVILAGGLSRRMGRRNKLLVDLDGAPMLRRSIAPYVALGFREIIVVTGHQAASVEAALFGLPLRFVHNPRFAEGQKTSVVSGLRAVSYESDVVIGLGDLPRLNQGDLEWLIIAHRDDSGERISMPTRGDDRGNPLIVPAGLRKQLLEDETAPGCHRFTRARPDLTHPVATKRAGFFHDIDTPHDLAALSVDAEYA